MPLALTLHRAACLAAASVAFALAGCGGGGGGGNGRDAATGTVSSGLYAPSASLANQCAVPDHQRWVRSYLDETYLWANDIPAADASLHATVHSYFDALLVRPNDRFSTVMSSNAANAMQGLTAAGSPSSFGAGNPVPLVRTLLSGNGRKVGYVLFNEHSQGAQDKLITAFTTLRNDGVQDLVLDLRYNSGGFLYVAQTAAALVAAAGIDGQVFETLRYSDRRSAAGVSETFIFSTNVQTAESTYGLGHPLPQLGLPRVYVLTSLLTCSASESIINSLRGVGIQVILIGDRTCGKPYGFHRKDNCGLAYFPIEFQVYNALGFGDFTAGFPVQCRVFENPTTALGAANEPLLAAALRHIDTGSCPAGTPTTAVAGVLVEPAPGPSPLSRPGAPSADSPMYQPGWDGRRRQP